MKSILHVAFLAAFVVSVVVCPGCGGGATPKPAPVTVAPKTPPAPPAAAAPKKAARAAVGDSGPAPVEIPFPDEPRSNVFKFGEVETTKILEPIPITAGAMMKVVEVVAPSRNSSDVTVHAPLDPPVTSPVTVNLPAGFEPIPEYGATREGLPLRIRCLADQSVMALIVGGTSYLGTDDGPQDARPGVVVELDPFYMDTTEVTLGQYEMFRSDVREKRTAQGSKVKTTPSAPLNEHEPAKYPALGLSYVVAGAYCKWAMKDLPTESEFERAARGPEGNRFPWGNGRALWPDKRQPADMTVVGKYQADLTPEGVFDLAGNAREWTHDWYLPTGHAEASKPGTSLKNWAGTKRQKGNLRVVKGCAPDWSAWGREGRDSNKRHADIGFRGVLRVTGSAPPP